MMKKRLKIVMRIMPALVVPLVLVSSCIKFDNNYHPDKIPDDGKISIGTGFEGPLLQEKNINISELIDFSEFKGMLPAEAWQFVELQTGKTYNSWADFDEPVEFPPIQMEMIFVGKPISLSGGISESIIELITEGGSLKALVDVKSSFTSTAKLWFDFKDEAGGDVYMLGPIDVPVSEDGVTLSEYKETQLDLTYEILMAVSQATQLVPIFELSDGLAPIQITLGENNEIVFKIGFRKEGGLVIDRDKEDNSENYE